MKVLPKVQEVVLILWNLICCHIYLNMLFSQTDSTQRPENTKQHNQYISIYIYNICIETNRVIADSYNGHTYTR